MRRDGGTAFGAVRPLDGRFVIVRTASASSSIAVFPFRNCHKSPRILVSSCQNNGIIAKKFHKSIGIIPENDIFSKIVKMKIRQGFSGGPPPIARHGAGSWVGDTDEKW